jgi:hypothetical protein
VRIMSTCTFFLSNSVTTAWAESVTFFTSNCNTKLFLLVSNLCLKHTWGGHVTPRIGHLRYFNLVPTCIEKYNLVTF